MQRLEIEICETCVAPEMGDQIEVSSSSFPFCVVCGKFVDTTQLAEVHVELISKEDCDCIEKHGQIRHNEGGNYHSTVYKVVAALDSAKEPEWGTDEWKVQRKAKIKELTFKQLEDDLATLDNFEEEFNLHMLNPYHMSSWNRNDPPVTMLYKKLKSDLAEINLIEERTLETFKRAGDNTQADEDSLAFVSFDMLQKIEGLVDKIVLVATPIREQLEQGLRLIEAFMFHFWKGALFDKD